MTYENGEARKKEEVCPPERALILMSKEDADLSDRLATRLRQQGLFVGQVYNCTAGKTYMKYNDDVGVLVLGKGYEHAEPQLKVADGIQTYVQQGSKLKRYENMTKQDNATRSDQSCLCGLESIATAPC